VSTIFEIEICSSKLFERSNAFLFRPQEE